MDTWTVKKGTTRSKLSVDAPFSRNYSHLNEHIYTVKPEVSYHVSYDAIVGYPVITVTRNYDTNTLKVTQVQ